MRGLLGFIKKEYMEIIRTGKLFFMVILFSLFGIMSPAIAKLTPWLMNIMSESLKETGIIITEVKVDAITSWTQFYKNIPIVFLVFFFLFSSILTMEYQKGTLIPILTKGLERWKIILAKLILLCSLWTGLYWLCYGITYAYNAYFWDNGIISSVFFPAFCIYLFGIYLLSLLLLFSVIFSSNTMVIIGVFGSCFGIYLLILLNRMIESLSFLEKYLPIYLFYASNLISNITEKKEYVYAIFATLVMIIFHSILTIFFFNKKVVN